MKTFVQSFLGMMALVVLVSACADLNVPNPNNPETARVLATPNDLKGVAGGAFVSLYAPWGANGTYNCNVHLEFTGDYITMTNNFRAFWSQFKVEPRPAFNNTLGFSDLDLIGYPFARWNASISNANDVIRAIEAENKQIGTNGAETQMVRMAAYMARGMARCYLANTFDQAYIVDYTTDLVAFGKNPTFSTYQQVLQAGLADLDTVIAVTGRTQAAGAPTSFPTGFINTPSPLTFVQINRLVRTLAANFLVQNARTRQENAQTNWQRVLAYLPATSLMTQDYIINLDGQNWQDGLKTIAGLDWYWRTDHRVIRIMDTTYAKRYPLPAATITYREATSSDARLKAYFRYEPLVNRFNTARGTQLRSHYRFARFDDIYATNAIGPVPFLYAETSRLLRAEALAMTGSVSEAITLLNGGRRKTVGTLPDIPATASREAVLEIIYNERDLELMLTDFGLHFKDMRRRGALQRGTILHFPVPATELGTIGRSLYTFGGFSNTNSGTADGVGGWYSPQ